MGQYATTTELLANSDNDHPDGDLYHSDHCCHGAAHLVGLIFNQTTPLVVNSDDGFVVPTQAPAFLYIAPLLRPPIG